MIIILIPENIVLLYISITACLELYKFIFNACVITSITMKINFLFFFILDIQRSSEQNFNTDNVLGPYSSLLTQDDDFFYDDRNYYNPLDNNQL